MTWKHRTIGAYPEGATGRDHQSVIRRLAIAFTWWLALGYGVEFGVAMYGLPHGVGPVAMVPVAMLIGATLPQQEGRPKDLRRLYRPRPDEGLPDGQAALGVIR